MELTERYRQTLLMVIAILALTCFFSSFILFVCAAYVKIKVDARMKLIETYNSNVLPAIFLFVGVINLAQNLTCLFVVLKMRNIENREGLMRMMFPVLIGGIVLVIFEFSTSIASFVHISILDAEFGAGLRKGMAEYVNGAEIKVEMDTVQLDYGCCGDIDYTDWFEYSWLDPQYLRASSRRAKKYFQSDGKYYSDDTPFSCCDVRAPRPCIHHHIHDNSRHHNYNYEVETTLYVRGCRSVLMDIYGRVLCTVAVIALLIALVKTTALLLFRLIQTSLIAAQEAGDWEATTPAYIYYLTAPDADLEEKKRLTGGSDSDANQSVNASSTDNETDENTNNDTEFDDDDNDEGKGGSARATHAANINYSQQHVSDLENWENVSHNKSSRQPVSLSVPYRPGSGYLDEKHVTRLPGSGYLDEKHVTRLPGASDCFLQNRWNKQPWQQQNGNFIAQQYGDCYQKDHFSDGNSGGVGDGIGGGDGIRAGGRIDGGCDDENLFAVSQNNKTDTYKLQDESDSSRLSGDPQIFSTQTLLEKVNHSDEGNGSISVDGSLMSAAAPVNQIKFQPMKSKPQSDRQGFAGKLLSILSDSLKPQQKFGNSANSYKYARVSTNSDSEEGEEEETVGNGEEDEEEEQGEDDETKEFDSSDEENGDASNDNNTADTGVIGRPRRQHTFEEVRNDTQEIPDEYLKADNSKKAVLQQQDQQATNINESYLTSDSSVQSDNRVLLQQEGEVGDSNFSQKTLRHATLSSSSSSLTCYHEVNEKPELKRRKNHHTLQSAKHSYNGPMEAKDSNIADQTLMIKRVSFSSTFEDAKKIDAVSSKCLAGLHQSKGNNWPDSKSPRPKRLQQEGFYSSNGLSCQEANFRGKSHKQQMDKRAKLLVDMGRNVHWPTDARLAELAGKNDNSETETGSGDDNSPRRHAFVGRYTPYPYEINRYKTRNVSDPCIDLGQSKSLQGELDDRGEMSNSDIIENEIEMPSSTEAKSILKNSEYLWRNQHSSAGWQMSRAPAVGNQDFQRSRQQQSLLTDETNDKQSINVHNTQDGCHPKMNIPLEFRSATKPFAFPIMQPSPSTFEMSTSVRNHIRSYQRRSVFLASPVSHSSPNVPLQSSSPHLALFNSPLLDSPMETSTPILCSERVWDSYQCQLLRTPACDFSSIQKGQQSLQESSRSEPVLAPDSCETVSGGTRSIRQAPVPGVAPPMTASMESQGQAVSQQLVAVESTLLIDEVFTSAEVCGIVHNVATAEQTVPQGRVLISPFN